MDNEDLRSKYPKSLGGCWEIAVGAGWLPLIEPLLAEAERLNDSTPGAIAVVQIKEKFGGLRFYYDWTIPSDGASNLHRMANEAEAASFKTCELCGKPAAQYANKNAWIHTLCEDCEKGKQNGA